MARQVVNEPGEDPQAQRKTISSCPVCDGAMVLAYDRYQQQVRVCADCNTSVSIPASAWKVAGAKGAARSFQGVERRRQHRRSGDLQMQ
jgi:ribosomal protein L37AE/L43A